MAFILSEDRIGSVSELKNAFERYQTYLSVNRERFPVGAFELASSEWYFSFDDPRAPHDAWLHELSISESQGEGGVGSVIIRIKLLNAQQDRFLQFSYSNVSGYELGLASQSGHRDWRYDEFRLTDGGQVLHEIEWAGAKHSARWKIISEDVAFSVVQMS